MSNQDNNLAQNLNNLNLNNGQQQQQQQSQQRFQFNPNAQSSFVPGGTNQYAQYGQYGQYGQQQQQQYGAGQYAQYGQYGQYGQNAGANAGAAYNQYGQYGQSNTQNQQGFQGYQRGGYNNRNYNNYNNYNGGYQQQQQPEEEETDEKTLTLEDYEKQKKAASASLSIRGRVKKNTPAPVVKTGDSSTTQTTAAETKTEPKAEIKAETKVEPKVEIKTEPKTEPKTETKTETKTEPKAETKAETKAPAAKKETPKKAAEASTESKESSATAVADAEALAKQQEAELDKEVLTEMFGADADVKEHMSIIFMGHVDAGKSTMGGNILFLTGAVDKRTVEKYEREAKDAGRQGWYLSWVMDTNKEERAEGKTVEVGRAFFETEKRRYTILDAPGHKMYVPSMIGGASQADVGILVISARKGEYETGFEKGGQTREHAILAKTQGVNRLIVVVNKMDDPTVKWSHERYEECTSKLNVFLKGIGYNPKTDLTFMPVSGYTGAGLKERVSKEDAPWYDGPALLEFLDGLKLEDRKLNAPFMLPISSKSKDLGTILEGKIESGSVKKGQSLLLMPSNAKVEVAAIFNESEAEVNAAICGEQVKLKVKGVEEEEVSTGFVLTSIKNPVQTATRFEAQVAIVEHKSILTTGFSCVMHIHTAVEEVIFTKLLHKLEKGTNRKSKKPPAFAKRGMKIIAELEATRPVCIEPFDDYPQLGRFTLRDQGITVAIGKVTKIIE